MAQQKHLKKSYDFFEAIYDKIAAGFNVFLQPKVNLSASNL